MKFFKKKIDWVVVIPLVLFGCLFFYVNYRSFKEEEYLNREYRYEIATVVKSYWNRGFINDFEYCVSDKMYSEWSRGLIQNNYEGKPYRYLIRYSVGKPSISEVIMDVPIPRYVKSAPPGGWKEYPPSIKWKGAEFDWSYIEKK